ncbi:MAG: haloacid dehalogenase-like hydrolase [Planctomycetota bacterium]|nr:haloacid dehalogenase-like hydrolase [Planctomycetota bacterium]
MSRKIAVIFDFDDTLAPDSTSAFLASIGVDVDDFWARRVKRRLEAHWDPIPAYLYEMIVESNTRPASDRITRDRLAAFAEQVVFFPGVKEIFPALRAEARAIDSDIEVEFYLISSGIGEILRGTSIADEFTDIWACDFHYGEDGEIVYPRNVVSFTEKTRFIFQISKGLVGAEVRANIAEVNRKMRGGFAIPFQQMVVVGDGQTDVPCFSLIKRYGGSAIGVCDPEAPSKWEKARLLVTDDRVESMCAAVYREGGGLHRTLHRSVKDIAQRIALADRGAGSLS